ncbi:hypothetical protein JZ751_028430 [Albula glossodonta]|uniref:Uncharacterized protein n=1 Tax=Albula glossodonta TaxID=121402 RepID=A0A8T2MS11_9TELE|nr:hypothetical protein JZ751_028430 [Albula glossodonta]
MTTGMNQMSLQGGMALPPPAQASSAAALCPSPAWEVALCRQMPLDSNSMAVASAPISAAPLSQGNMPSPSTDPFLNRYCTPLSLNHPRVCPHILQHCLLSQIRVHIH